MDNDLYRVFCAPNVDYHYVAIVKIGIRILCHRADTVRYMSIDCVSNRSIPNNDLGDVAIDRNSDQSPDRYPIKSFFRPITREKHGDP